MSQLPKGTSVAMPNLVDQWLQLAVRQHQAGQPAAAEPYYRQILAVVPRHFDALHLLGVAAHQAGRHAEAVDLIGRAIASNRKQPAAHNNLGEALRSLGRLEEAAAAYRRALVLQPGYADAHNNLGTVLRRLGRPEEAVASFQRALARLPGHAGALNNLGMTLRQLGRVDEAIDCFRQALVTRPNLAEAHHNLGNALAAKGRLTEAVASLGQAVALNTGFAEAHLHLGQRLMDLGRFPEAELSLARAAELMPDSLEAILGLGLAQACQGKLRQALTQATATTRFQEQPAFPHYTLGVLLAKCGQEAAARVAFETCLARNPEDGQGARMALAGLGHGAVPERAPEALLNEIYTNRAAAWNRAAGDVGAYAAPSLIAEALARLCGGREDLDILDAGCGTGLVGQVIHGHGKRLEGIDMSSAMLDHAGHWGCYQALHHGDMVAFMSASPERFDVIVSAATLIHFGDLAPVFEGAATALRDHGLFIFTLFPFEGESDDRGVAVGSFDGFAQGGCFMHGRRHVRRLAEATGHAVEILEDRVHEYHNGIATTGLLVALRRLARPGAAMIAS